MINKGIIERFITRCNGAVREVRRRLVLAGKIKEKEKKNECLLIKYKRKRATMKEYHFEVKEKSFYPSKS